jgi:hypothetical protein
MAMFDLQNRPSSRTMDPSAAMTRTIAGNDVAIAFNCASAAGNACAQRVDFDAPRLTLKRVAPITPLPEMRKGLQNG